MLVKQSQLLKLGLNEVLHLIDIGKEMTKVEMDRTI